MANLKRILIADDEESIRLLLRRILESNPAL
jgi:CheY-like chemotaxis protein